MTRKATCSIRGCKGKVRARGWCEKHYRRWRVHGDPLTVIPFGSKPKNRICVVEGCDRPHSALGWCQMHRLRVKETGEVGPPGPLKPPTYATCCHPDGCERLVSGKDGWCHMHAERIAAHGEPGPAEAYVERARKQPVLCWALTNAGEMCGRPTVAKGLCVTHAKRLQRNGTLDVVRRRVGV